VRKRGLADRILAWVYSTDFPTAVKTDPVMSLQGITFLRNRTLPREMVAKGRYRSPFYSGPHRPGDRAHLTQTFDTFREWVGPDMPIPSMMLGVIGTRGLRKARVLKNLERGKAADGTCPAGTIYLVRQDRIRSTPRHWQFQGVRRDLSALGVDCVITNAFPAGKRDVMGIQMGAPEVVIPKGTELRPGSMADHLTSLAGVFEVDAQTKLTTWLDAGATASAGTVVEPLSIWTKFPAARFYVHYASGCSMIESFYQSVRCPLQILLVGDPLAAPWARPPRVRLEAPDTLARGTDLVLQVTVKGEGHYGDIRFWLNGQPLKAYGRRVSVGTDALVAGEHRIRVVAYQTGFLRIQGFAEHRFRVTQKPQP
jgi:hypothetical protein